MVILELMVHDCHDITLFYFFIQEIESLQYNLSLNTLITYLLNKPVKNEIVSKPQDNADIFRKQIL